LVLPSAPEEVMPVASILPVPPAAKTVSTTVSLEEIKKVAAETAAKLPPIKEPEVIAPAGMSIGTDVQKILSEVKLPERRDFKAAADTKPASQVPKNLSAMVVKPPTAADEARAMTKPEATGISSVHTLKDDLQYAVKEKKMSLVRAVSLEQDKKRTEFVEEDFGRKERRKRITGILFASGLLFALGFAALFGVYVVMTSYTAAPTQQLNSIVFAEQSVALPLDNATPSELKRRVAGERQVQTGSLGSITRIVPIFQGTGPDAQPRQATTAEFFTVLGFRAPDDLLRSLGTEFFFGLHVVDKNAPVLVIPITNYSRAFAGMLAWESTMNSDLAPVFTALPVTIFDANAIPQSRVFSDDVMRNYDVRELKDDSGEIQLYYSFPSTNLLIIAESPYSFPELLSRLQSVRRL
jgi:hypothetical protein